jgi:hypothetical protein
MLCENDLHHKSTLELPMSDSTAKVLVAVIGLLGSVVWPALLFWSLRYFHEPIKKMLENLKSAKGGGYEITFAERVMNLETDLQKTNLVVVEGLSKSSNPQIVEAASKLRKPPGDLVADWAQKHGADNPWDLGPRNWERCLWDLGYGGKPNELVTENGKLKYQ